MRVFAGAARPEIAPVLADFYSISFMPGRNKQAMQISRTVLEAKKQIYPRNSPGKDEIRGIRDFMS